MFSIEMLPANDGDALWIEYAADPVRRILIDCGRKTAYRSVINRLAKNQAVSLELFVMTHVDSDHISGAVRLLQDERFGADRVHDVWFNGWRHLNRPDLDHEEIAVGVLSATEGEYFGALLMDRGYAWNEAFGGQSAVIEEGGALPCIELAGNMRLTLLGPTWDMLSEMRRRWEDELTSDDPDKQLDPGDYERALELLGSDRWHRPDLLGAAHLGPVVVSELVEIPFDPDDSEPNGSSISFLAEHDGRSVLFTADAHAPQIEASIRRLLDERGLEQLKVDVVKMAHHGSAKNNSFELLELLDCQRYLISTNGWRHHHPDPESLARVLSVHGRGVEFYFNYSSHETLLWSDPGLITQHGFKTFYPESSAGLKISL